MELRQLEYLIAVCDTGSFSAAARRLGVRQPSISQQIRKLENQLRQPLLDRLPGRVLPTAAGRQLAEHARRILDEVAEANRRINDLAGPICGPVRVGAIPTIAPFLFPPIFRTFERRYPKVELTLIEETTPVLLEGLSDGEIDLAIASTVPPTQHLHVETVTDEPLMLMLPARHRLTRQGEIVPSSLKGERFVALHEMHCLADQSARFCRQSGLHPPTVVHGSNLYTLARMVAAGAGVTLAPAMLAATKATVSGCAFRPFCADVPTRPITIVWSLLRYRPQAVRKFADMAKSLLCGSHLTTVPV